MDSSWLHMSTPEKVITMTRLAMDSAGLPDSRTPIEYQDEGDGLYIINIDNGFLTIANEFCEEQSPLKDVVRTIEKWKVSLWFQTGGYGWNPPDVDEAVVGTYSNFSMALEEAAISLIRMQIRNTLAKRSEYEFEELYTEQEDAF